MRKFTGAFIISLFFTDVASGYIVENIPNSCTSMDLYAKFEPIDYTCPAGYFLPANTLGCVPCPTDFECPGGVYSFNENIAQGVVITGRVFHTMNNMCQKRSSLKFAAKFTPNVHTCSPGYYMPANTDGCVICPANSYCSGGTFTFNETVTQGIDTCPMGSVAPTGMWELSQCGRTLHVGTSTIYLRTTKRTSPSLHIDINGDGTADYFANIIATDAVMNRDSSQKLKLQMGENTYSICDDTVLGYE